MRNRFMDRSQRDLLDESQDLHSDAMRSTQETLDELIDRERERSSRVDPDESRTRGDELSAPGSRGAVTAEHDQSGLSVGAAGATGIAAALAAGLVAVSASAAYAGQSSDVQILQTQAAIENLAVATYSVALTLPFIGGSKAIPLVKEFVTQTRAQHTEHAQTFNAALRRLNAKTQNKPDPVLLALVNKAKPGLTTPGAVVDLAIELEAGAAATYVKNAATIKDQSSRVLTASIMGVEAQHVAILLAVQALIKGGDASMITLPPPLANLPAAAGSVGFPQPFFSTSQARPNNEGAVN